MKTRRSTAVLAAAATALVAALAAGIPSAQAPTPGPAQAPPAPATATATAAPADPPPVVFRVEVNYVEVDAVVTDAQGNLVPGLTADDFELVEDGKPQKISAFSLVNIPIERAERPLFSAQPVEPDVQTNAMHEGRLYLIVLDDQHTSPLNAIKVKTAVHQFLEQSFGVNDIAAVVYTGGHSRDTQDFTNNRRLLLAAVYKFTGLGMDGPTMSRVNNYNTGTVREMGDPLNDPLEAERAYKARSAMDRIRALANFMAGVRGRRKAMLLVGEGIEYNFNDILSNNQAGGVLESVREAIGAATRANVAIYTIDPRGLVNPGAELITSASSPSADDPSLGDLGTRSLAREFRQAQDSLRTLAADTGGFAVLNQNDFRGAFDRIVRENSNYYVLGYYPTNDRRDGRFRAISLRVKRPGLQVRARRGYVAPRGKAPDTKAAAASANTMSPTLAAAMTSPLPVRDVPLRVFAAPYKGPAPNATVAVAVEVGVEAFAFTEGNGTFNGQVEMSLAATDSEGKVRGGNRANVRMAMKPDTYARAKARGVRVLSTIDLPPGRYQLRVAAGDATTRAGSVVEDIEVPDFTKLPLSMSGLALTSASAGRMTTVKSKDLLDQLLPGPITTEREFDRTDELALYAEFYENTPKDAPAHKVDITMTLLADGGRVVHEDRAERSSTELQGKSGGYGYSTRIPLRDYEPGLYVIHVQARSRTSKDAAGIGRDVQIRIR